MKNISLLLLAGVLFFTSCQKQNDELALQNQEATADAGTAKLSAWKGATFTTNEGSASGSSFSSEISDPSIDASILSDGLVLVYSRDNNSVSTLPFAQASGIEWSYELKNGGISISANSSKTISALSGLQFAYVVIPAEKIASLEENGTSVNDLMNFSFASAERLFANSTASNN